MRTESRPTVIVGAAGPEVVKLIEAINDAGPLRYTILGFLDDDPEKHGGTFLGHPILGPVERIAGHHRNCWVVNNVAGSTAARQAVWERLSGLGAMRFPVLAHPSVDLRHVEVGEGTIIQEGAIIGPLTRIGAHCLINFKVSIGHESAVGDAVFIGPGATLAGRVNIREAAFLGSGCVILPNRTVGERSVVGAGSTVTADVPADSTVFGVPARVIMRRTQAVEAASRRQSAAGAEWMAF